MLALLSSGTCFFFFFNTCLLYTALASRRRVFLKGQLLSACRALLSERHTRLQPTPLERHTREQSLSIHYSRHAPAPRAHTLYLSNSTTVFFYFTTASYLCVNLTKAFY